MTTYSAFFSSGLLAPHHIYDASANLNVTPSKHSHNSSSFNAFSPAAPSSPIALPDDSDIEIDTPQRRWNRDSEGTPTPSDPMPLSIPHPHSRTLSTASTISTVSTASTASITGPDPSRPQPRLRKRKSSLTVGAGPMNAIKSPARTAGAAAQLQRHLGMSPAGRPRSGSLTFAFAGVQGTSGGPDVFGGMRLAGNVASDGTSLVGRMRSGSVGGGMLRAKRPLRRAPSGAPPPLPAPTAPLPPLPPSKHAAASGTRAPHDGSASAGHARVGRDRSYSIDNGYFIDEEMKES